MARRRIPRWAIWAGGVLLLVLVAALTVRGDWFIPLAERKAAAALGRPVHIAHLHLQLGRPLRLVAEGLEIGNPPGFPAADPPLARLDRAEVAVALRPLLHGALELPEVVLDHPQLALLATPDGATNYTLASSGGGGEPPRIGRILIQDGQAQVRIPRLRADFHARFATEGEDIGARAEGTYAGQPIQGEFRGGALLSLRDDDTPWPMRIDLANGATRLHLEGSIRRPLHLGGAALTLVLSGPDMKQLTPLIGLPLATTPPFRVSGQLDYGAGTVRFSQIQGKVGSSDLAGDISVNRGGARPQVHADLRSERLDLADLGGFIGSQPGRRGTPDQTPAQRQALARAEASDHLLPTAPLNLPALRAADVRLKYRARHIIDDRVPLDDFALDTTIEDGTVHLAPLRFGVGRGTIGGSLTLTPHEGGGLAARGEFELRRVEVARLLAPMGVRGGGTLGGIANIEGQGASVSQLLGNANGALTVAMVGGNLSALVVDLSGLQFGRALLSALGVPERTDIRCLVGDFVLRRGVLQTRSFVLDTDSSVVNANGSVDLGHETLDLALRTRSKGLTIGSLPTTIGIGGRFKDPQILPDLGELAARGGAAVGLGLLLPPLALLPTIQLGVGEDQQCAGVVAAARNRGR